MDNTNISDMKNLNLLDKKIKCQELEILELKQENKYQLDMHQDLLGQIARLKQKLKRYDEQK